MAIAVAFCALTFAFFFYIQKVTIASVDGTNGCARPPLAQFDTDKSSDAKNQCNGKIPQGLVTNGMCVCGVCLWLFTPLPTTHTTRSFLRHVPAVLDL